MITEAIARALGFRRGHMLTEGFQVKCAGTPGTDANGNPIVIDRHLICTLDDPLPGADFHAIGNQEFIDKLWLIDPAQTSINWSNPTCCLCGKGIAP